MKQRERKDIREIGDGAVTEPQIAEEPAVTGPPYVRDYPGEPAVGATDPSNIEFAR